MPAFAMTSDGRMAFTHLSFGEQGAQYRAEQGQAQQVQAGEQGGEASGGGEEAEQDDGASSLSLSLVLTSTHADLILTFLAAPVAYPLVSTQGSGLFAASSSSGAALGSGLFAASSSSGAALGSPYTPEEQMARSCAELARQQSKQKIQEEKD